MRRTPNPCDNQTEGPERPFAVTQDELERALRETFARRVAAPGPLAADPAALAIRRANRTVRRRALAGLALAGAATVLVTTGTAQFGDRPGHQGSPIVVLGDPRTPAPLPTASPSTPSPKGPVRAELDLIIGSWLEGSGGERRELTDVGPVDRAQRVADHGGWLVTSVATAAGRTLWWVPPNGSAPQVLLAGADAIALAPDGRQLAWRDGRELLAAALVGGQLFATTGTPAPDGAVPVGFVGDAVLVRQPGQGGFTVWRRLAGALPAAAERSLLNVYGVLPDGRVVGQVSAGTPRRPCLALLDPARGLAPVRTGCGPELGTDGRGGVSADGRWLLVNGAGKDALLVDLDTLGSTVSARSAGPAVTDVVAWTPTGTALHVDGAGGLVRVRVERVLAGERPGAASVGGVTPGERPVLVSDTTS
ncbi:hypothetical protein U2F26_03625 [Micromonospora sp. 4G57]|uniref:WD40 repeat domain-containing protein n=1 Tax=Micromonospora sicca TaxID=2202420 RepID=A0ABU5J9R1_9ACTN|nr:MULTISPECIES: hypothetical protein [unclassified Micromonospora]MDZ5441823.1 hypothetical protein [Micromonospora sp. 4G57]MDZ5489325.1 hypothetical protein [Micromonospora sp. 4G53]